MRRTSVYWVLRTNLGITFKITLFFDTFYAVYVEEKTGFFAEIKNKFEDVLFDTLEDVFSSSGLEITVIR